MTTSDNRTRPACRSRWALTRADLIRHVEGDYGSEGDLVSFTQSGSFCCHRLNRSAQLLGDLLVVRIPQDDVQFLTRPLIAVVGSHAATGHLGFAV
jgi:hypothetical protein